MYFIIDPRRPLNAALFELHRTACSRGRHERALRFLQILLRCTLLRARAPMFEGVTADGKVRSFTPSGFLQPTIVIFYRGGWCPYCNMQLSDMRLVEPQLRAQALRSCFEY